MAVTKEDMAVTKEDMAVTKEDMAVTKEHTGGTVTIVSIRKARGQIREVMVIIKSSDEWDTVPPYCTGNRSLMPIAIATAI
jgi:hypothetical protein